MQSTRMCDKEIAPDSKLEAFSKALGRSNVDYALLFIGLATIEQVGGVWGGGRGGQACVKDQ